MNEKVASSASSDPGHWCSKLGFFQQRFDAMLGLFDALVRAVYILADDDVI